VLTRTVLELERHVAQAGWDAPLRVFAVVDRARGLAADPRLRALIGDDDPHSTLICIEQEGLPPGRTLEEVLGQIAWPETVDGAAVVVERFVVPPHAERGLPDDPQAAVEALLAHPERQDVRLAVVVMRDGGACCAVRTRVNDRDDAVGTGDQVAPGLVEALRATLS
jgi:hypothetical protein